ncbi:MAG: SulP family inorganic anion transporter [Cloacibacillus evryensis]
MITAFTGETAFMFENYVRILRSEFRGYNADRLAKDFSAGMTVAAVALPLALAFGVGSGADAAAGLITAIIGGIVMSLFSGASFQISGPTGAMSAVLAIVVARTASTASYRQLYGRRHSLAVGIFKLGKFIFLIPAPVITGFTSGIAVIIAWDR